MNKKGKIALTVTFVVMAVLIVSLVLAGKPAKQCNDGLDNDGDGYTDLNDPGCASKNDDSELNPSVECDDGVDNDGDSAVDYNDNGCSGPSDTDETDCGDGVCEGGETSGTCPADCGYPDSCSETDGGNVISVYGTTSGYYNNAAYSNNDYCVDSSNIMEYYCSGNYEQSAQQSCGTDGYGSAYCGAGYTNEIYIDFTDYFCTSGACDSTVTPSFQEDCDDYDYNSDLYCVNSTYVFQDHEDFYCSNGGCSSSGFWSESLEYCGAGLCLNGACI